MFGKGRGYGWKTIPEDNRDTDGLDQFTLSKTERQIVGINNGSWYNAPQDQTHNFSVVGIYQYIKKWTFSATWVYNTGNATTWPSGKFP